MKQIKTQNELDEAIKAGETDVEFTAKGTFEINCKFLKVSVKAALMWDVLLKARGSSRVEARGSSRVEAWGSSSVVARESSSVEARESSSVEAWESSRVEAWESSRVEARGSSRVEAWGSSSVVARESSSVEARESSSVVAWGSSRVEAWANAFIRLFSALSIKASSYVIISVHGKAGTLEGGRQLPCAPDPTNGREWCEFNGIDPIKVDYIVPNIDAKILQQIEKKPDSFDMGSWHGEECDETNWCNTTHCRAGYAICLAGKPGFDLEKKYGSELAGSMIYAVSRPDMPLPDFHATDDEALEDIRAGSTA